jgi:hypothetical protein
MKTGTNLWSYRDTISEDFGNSWIGYHVHATDGDIGKVDEMTFDTGRGSLVVDTGPWIFGSKRHIPGYAVQRVDHADRKVYVCLTKEQVKHAPEFDAERRNEDRYYDVAGQYYSPFIG